VANKNYFPFDGYACISPIRLAIVLQEFSPDVFAGVEARDDRVHDARRALTLKSGSVLIKHRA